MRLIFLCSIIIISSCSPNNESTTDNKGNAETIALNQTDSEINISGEKKIQIETPLDSLLFFDSEASLKKVYGNQVIRSKGYYEEGMGEYSNTLLDPNTSDEVEFVWIDTINFRGLDHIKISGKETHWLTSEGITLGTSLKELEEINQKPFSFYGFGWDYSGMVTSQDGYLFEKKIFIRLEYPGKRMPLEFEGLVGEQEIKSNSELAQKCNPVVSEITIRK